MNKMKDLLKVVIFIPAYNEESNIHFLLDSICRQKEEGFVISKIVVISDGSSDETVARARAVEDPRIEVAAKSDRQGKVARINEMFAQFDADVLVQFDADVIMKNQSVILELVKPFVINPSTDLVCGEHESLPAKSYIEKVAKLSDDFWEQAKADLGDQSMTYRCLGQIRAFSQKFAHTLRMPLDVGTNEDVYSYYFAKVNNYTVVAAPKAVVLFRLVSTLRDYVKQMIRMIPIHGNMAYFFGKKVERELNTMTFFGKAKALIKVSIHNRPDILLAFLFIHGLAKLLTLFIKPLPVWDVSESTKHLVK